MSSYVRFILTDDRPTSIEELESALRQVDKSYAINGDVITFADAALGLLDITRRGDPICDDDLNLLMRQSETKRNREVIQATIRNAKSLLCVQLLNTQDEGAKEYFAPLWNWLLANRAGLLTVEGGQFFDGSGPLA